MRLTRNHINFSGNFGKIDPRIHFDVFQNCPHLRPGDFEKRKNSSLAPKLPSKPCDYGTIVLIVMYNIIVLVLFATNKFNFLIEKTFLNFIDIYSYGSGRTLNLTQISHTFFYKD